jgi:hypothetical protein
MPFIENASHFSLGDGVYNNVLHGNIYHFHNSKRSREEMEGKLSLLRSTPTVDSIQIFRWIGFGTANTTGGEASSIE